MTSLRAAESELQRELAFTVELAYEANSAFQQSVAGQRVAHRWLYGDDVPLPREIDEYETISQALVQGLARPRCELESACFWILAPGKRDD